MLSIVSRRPLNGSPVRGSGSSGKWVDFTCWEWLITNGRFDVNQGILVPEHEFPNTLVEGFRVFFVEEVASIQDGQFRLGDDAGEFF